MSEFLGTVMIIIVLWFGGILVLNYGSISGPTFIYYLVILYSIINPQDTESGGDHQGT